MHRLLASVVLASGAICAFVPIGAKAADRTLPMQFELRHELPADACGNQCLTWISAAGAITADTPRTFHDFVHGRDLQGVTIALDSDGGSVLGAIALGRQIRALGLATTVGRTVEIDGSKGKAPHVILSPRADCESMCPFVLLAGANRSVPAEARVLVHQIWLGDRRDDPTAANYSAEDLVLVQRDIGRLAQYTAEMGAPAELLNLALRIPPWEPMHALTRDELKRTGLLNGDVPPERAPAVTMASSTTASTGDGRATRISERGWAVIDNSGAATLARRHPLTVEGDEIGSFDLMVACDGNNGYQVSYVESRHAGSQQEAAPVSKVTLRVGQLSAPLKVVSSQHQSQPLDLDTMATGTVPADLIKAFAAIGNHSMTISTTSAGMSTSIRIGNTGALQNLPLLSANCTKTMAKRADLMPESTRGAAQRR